MRISKKNARHMRAGIMIGRTAASAARCGMPWPEEFEALEGLNKHGLAAYSRVRWDNLRVTKVRRARRG